MLAAISVTIRLQTHASAAIKGRFGASIRIPSTGTPRLNCADERNLCLEVADRGLDRRRRGRSSHLENYRRCGSIAVIRPSRAAVPEVFAMCAWIGFIGFSGQMLNFRDERAMRSGNRQAGRPTVQRFALCIEQIHS